MLRFLSEARSEGRLKQITCGSKWEGYRDDGNEEEEEEEEEEKLN